MQFCRRFSRDGRQGVVECKKSDVAKMTNLVGGFKGWVSEAVRQCQRDECGADDSGESVWLSQFPSTGETD